MKKNKELNYKNDYAFELSMIYMVSLLISNFFVCNNFIFA
jgi:hypothetical protein